MVDVTSSSGGDDDSAEESGSGNEGDLDADAEADYQYALQMQEELNGMRARPARNYRQVGQLLLGIWCSAAQDQCLGCSCRPGFMVGRGLLSAPAPAVLEAAIPSMSA